jgi:hypothetical protein
MTDEVKNKGGRFAKDVPPHTVTEVRALMSRELVKQPPDRFRLQGEGDGQSCPILGERRQGADDFGVVRRVHPTTDNCSRTNLTKCQTRTIQPEARIPLNACAILAVRKPTAP